MMDMKGSADSVQIPILSVIHISKLEDKQTRPEAIEARYVLFLWEVAHCTECRLQQALHKSARIQPSAVQD